ncbi:hypothetical protein CC80DRAFT_411478 [Byssothecium circinans]|uniref:RAVE complex protein Rav1 C-terminal domain-containing protein n=1 Tax=Byssothecium circinans TaxID=147558 RepID=A0A6A5TZE8_9PLEO|nr:hypothetical protein CC80DRAFT_411478 [Byssothecium circinans]
MRDILPGRPQAKLQAVTHGLWERQQIIAYISGNALIILDSPSHVLQTTYIDEETELEAVALDENTGKLAVCSTHHIYIYKPYGQDEGAVKWSLQGSVTLPDPDDSITTLSWGLADELLAGSASLTLFNAHGATERIWTKRLANTVKFAYFSPDAELIASTGRYDRLLKIWRRLAYGSEDQHFDYYYLPHPNVITGIHWRQPFHREQTADNVLYTICADYKVRIWVTGEHHGMDGMALWTEVDLFDSIKPRSLDHASEKRFAFFVDGKYFTHATERAVQQATAKEKDEMALNHLIEVANRNPEICVVLDDRGNMTAWGFENIGGQVKRETDVFSVAHMDGLHLHFANEPTALQDNVQFYAFCHEKPDSAFTILAHHFDGRVEWLQARMDYLLDPSPAQSKRIQRKAVWTGHSHAIKKVNRTPSGRALVSRTVTDECIVWVQRPTEHGMTLHRHSTVKVTEHIHRTSLLQEGNFIVFLHHEHIALWDTRGPAAAEVARLPYKLQGRPLCLLVIPETQPGGRLVHIATISSAMKSICWEVRLPLLDRDPVTGRKLSTISSMTNGYTNGHNDISIEEFSTFDLGSGNDLAFVLPVDPAGSAPVISGFLDTFARDIAISYTKSGIISSWTARVNIEERKLEWLQTSMVETGIPNPSLASGTSIRKAALVDSEKTTLTIWNTRSAQLEYEEAFEGNGVIQDLDWSSTPDNQSILAVGFPHRVVIYAQLRYDYLNAGPSWVQIRDVRIRDITPHPIGDSVWLGSGNLVIGAGNQLFIQDENVEVSEGLFPSLRTISRKKASIDIFTAVSRLNGPLPVYHPQLLSQCVLSGKLLLAQRILIRLFQKLKFWTEGEELDSSLGFSAEEFSEGPDMTASRKEMHSSYADFSDDTEPETVTEEVASSLNELVQTKQIPLLSSREQFHLADIIECVGMVEKHRRSIDDNAGRFLLFFRQHVLNEAKTGPISWREITWAFHSQSQDILVDLVSRHFSAKMLWQHAKESGMFMWMTDITALRAQFEVIARNEYTKTEDKNPVDCSLHYLALRKKPVLLGLWRMATWSREQTTTHRLLSNNFNEPRWKTAALKNAYALMGRRRFEYAAAFFLLADHLLDAISVLHNQLGDTQLAITVARVYGGDASPILQTFLREKILPQAAREGNRWLATWAFWMINKRDSAVRSLVSPLSSLVESSESGAETPSFESRSFLTDDPALVVIYRQLREKSLQTLRGASRVGMREEWEFVIKTAELYGRMGCDVLALDLVKTWEFLTPPPPTKRLSNHPPLSPAIPNTSFHARNFHQSATDFDFDPRKLLRRRSSLVVADLPAREHLSNALAAEKGGVTEVSSEGDSEGEMEEKEKKRYGMDGKGEKKEEKMKPPPTQFNEPDANSLLDAFGF